MGEQEERAAEVAAVLARVPPFSEMRPVERAKLAAALEDVTVEAGTQIFFEGQPADALYILREGQVARQVGGTHLGLLEPPEVFGDVGLLRGEPRTATLVARTRCRLWKLPGSRFTRLVRDEPRIAARFAADVSTRLSAAQREIGALGDEAEVLARHLYESLSSEQQETLERLALPERIDAVTAQQVFGTHDRMGNLPLSAVLIPAPAASGGPGYVLRPTLRRLLLERLEARLGPERLARERAALVVPTDRAAGTDASAVVSPERAAAAKRGWRPSQATLGLALAALILLVGWLLPPQGGLETPAWRALVTLIAIVPLLGLNALPEGIVALALGTVWVVGGVAPARVAFGGFATAGWVLVVTVLAVGTAMASSGLLYRLALWAVAHARGGFGGQVLTLASVGVLLSPANPNATGRVMLIAPAVPELVDAFGYTPKKPAAVGLSMGVLTGFGQLVSPFLTSSTTAVLVYAVLPESARQNLDFASWFVRALPTNIILFSVMMAAVFWLYRPRGEALPAASATRRSAVELQREMLGPLSRRERTVMWVTLGTLAGFVTQPLHRVDPAWVGVAAMVCLVAAGAFNADDLRGMNWSFALFFGILPSMAEVMTYVRLDTWLGGLISSAIGGLTDNRVLFLAVLTLLGFAISFILRWQAAAPLLTVAMTPVAIGAGMDPWVVGMVALIACNGFFLPYMSTTYLAMYHGTGGRLFTHEQARPMAFAQAIATLLAVCGSVPFWAAMGLL